MRRVFRISTAAYPAMAAILIGACFLSTRTPSGPDTVRDHVFPFIRYEHPLGAGTFTPGCFVLNFFSCSLLLMGILDLAFPSRFGALLPGRANIFFYIFVLIVAILEVAADTLLPILALHGRYAFGLAISIVHAGFLAALALAAAVSRGANRDW